MRSDIENRDDIDVLMSNFYDRAMADDEIGYIFTDVAQLNLETHLPVIGDFWETMLFRSGDYARHGRNPMEVHRQLHLISPLDPKHFLRWLELFEKCVDEGFAGPRAEFIKMRARAIAGRFQENLGIGLASCEPASAAAPEIR